MSCAHLGGLRADMLEVPADLPLLAGLLAELMLVLRAMVLVYNAASVAGLIKETFDELQNIFQTNVHSSCSLPPRSQFSTSENN